jgi:hypothetical protein
MGTNDMVSSLAPAAFGLLGTVVGAMITYLSAHSERRSMEDNQARARLADTLNAIDRIGWTTRVGVLSPDDAAPGTLSEKLRLSIAAARGPLLTAGIAFDTVSAALQPAENLSIRWDSRTVDPIDPDDATALVAYLYQVLDRHRFYRRTHRILRALKQMEQFTRGARLPDGVVADRTTFGKAKVGAPP